MKRHILIVILLMMAPGFAIAQSLEEYQKISASNNPGLQSKYLQYQAALEQVPQVGVLPDPQVSFGYFISPVETRVGPQIARISVSQMFPWTGTLSAARSVAAEQAKLRFQAFLTERDRIFYEVSQAYYELLGLNETIALLREEIRLLESYEGVARAKMEGGTGSMVDVLRVQMQIRQLHNEVEVLQLQMESLQVQFNLLLNREADADVTLPEEIPAIGPSMATADSLVQNPQFDELAMQRSVIESQESLLRRQGLPSIGLGMDYVMIGERTDMEMEDNGKDALMPMVTLKIPLWRKQYSARASQLGFDRQALDYQEEALNNRLQTEWAAAQSNLAQATEQAQLYQRQLQDAQTILNLLTTDYSTDASGFEEVIRMEQEKINLQKALIEAKVQQHLAMEKMNYLTGY